jgi:hypothetical protein
VVGGMMGACRREKTDMMREEVREIQGPRLLFL